LADANGIQTAPRPVLKPIGRIGGQDRLLVGLAAIDHDPLGSAMPLERLAQEPLGSRQITFLAEPELDGAGSPYLRRRLACPQAACEPVGNREGSPVPGVGCLKPRYGEFLCRRRRCFHNSDVALGDCGLVPCVRARLRTIYEFLEWRPLWVWARRDLEQTLSDGSTVGLVKGCPTVSGMLRLRPRPVLPPP